MSDKAKALTTAIAVLLVGIASGALVVGPSIARSHFRHAERVRGREGFVAAMEGRIKPSPDQAEAVKAVLTKYGEHLDALRASQRKEAEAIFDSLDTELAPILTPEQKARLEERHRHAPPPQENKEGQK